MICDRADFDWARELVRERAAARALHGAVQSRATDSCEPRELARWILDERLPVRFQMQLHKYLWGDTPGYAESAMPIDVAVRSCCSPAAWIRRPRSRSRARRGCECHALSVDYGQRHRPSSTRRRGRGSARRASSIARCASTWAASAARR